MGVSTSGIIFADLFVNSEEDFVRYFTEYFNANRVNVENAIAQLTQTLTNIQTKTLNVDMADKFHQDWNNFQKVVLLNDKDLELIVGYRAPGKTAVTMSTVIPISEATQGGNLIQTGNEAVRRAVALGKQVQKAQEVEAALTTHLNGFITMLNTKISPQEKEILITDRMSAIPDKWKKMSGRLTDLLDDRKWQDIFYANYYTGQGLGKAYDAYMNHVANHHTAVYSYLASGGANSETLQVPRIKNSVYTEEGGVSGNFPYLLNESLNTTGWYTGGDIVIVDPQTMSVVYNIQLKTTQEGETKTRGTKIPSNFNIAIEKLKVYINGGKMTVGKNTYHFSALSTLPPEEKARQLFRLLKTNVSNYSAFDNSVQETIDDIIKQGITEKARQINITLQL